VTRPQPTPIPLPVVIRGLRGVRITFAGTASAPLLEAAQAIRTALEADYDMEPVGAAVARTSGKGINVGVVLFETGFAVLRQRGSRIILTLEMDGAPDLDALETLVVETFGLSNHTMVADVMEL
jgi:hypothetical protein